MKPSGLVLAVAVLVLSGCSNDVRGVYSNPEGNASVEFMPDGKAHFSFSGVGGDCTYAQQDEQVSLACAGETTKFTVGDDGALTGPPDSFVTRLTKKS